MRSLLVLWVLAASLTAADGTYEANDDRPMLGIEMSPVPSNVQTQQGLGADEGVLVRNVFPGTAAADMGIQAGDVVTSVNGAPIGSMTDLRNAIGSHAVGDAVAVGVRRGGVDVPMASILEPWPAHIPFDRIDADAEQRFKDWQQRRQARHRDEIGKLSQEVAALRDQLEKAKDPTGFTDAPAVTQAENLLRLLPAWTFSYRYDTDKIAPARGAKPAGLPAEGRPWSAVVINSTDLHLL